MSFFVVDVEADGPCPGLYSMIELGAVKVDDELTTTFYHNLKPISDDFVEEALNVTGLCRNQTLIFHEPKLAMDSFAAWVKSVNKNGRPIFVSDNLAFDWQFVNYYFHRFCGENPFGFSGRRIGDLYCGLVKDSYAKWKHLRKTAHDHNPVNDAKGNAEVLLYMKKEMGLKIGW